MDMKLFEYFPSSFDDVDFPGHKFSETRQGDIYAGLLRKIKK